MRTGTGKTTQLRGGLKGGELVVLSLPSSLTEGARIQPVERKPSPAPGEQRQGVGGSGRRGG